MIWKIYCFLVKTNKESYYFINFTVYWEEWSTHSWFFLPFLVYFKLSFYFILAVLRQLVKSLFDLRILCALKHRIKSIFCLCIISYLFDNFSIFMLDYWSLTLCYNTINLLRPIVTLAYTYILIVLPWNFVAQKA